MGVNEAREIPRLPVDSTAFASVGYDETRQVLSIAFKSGHIWHYRTVSSEAFEAFAHAPSRGSWFAKHIRGQFPSEQMTGLCPKCLTIGLVGEACADCKTTIRVIEAHRKP